MSLILKQINRALGWWVELCTGRKQSLSLDEEHYRQRILAITSLFWLLTVVALVIIVPQIIDMSPDGSFAARLLFVATSLGVLASMLVLRHMDNRFLALHMLLLICSYQNS